MKQWWAAARVMHSMLQKRGFTEVEARHASQEAFASDFEAHRHCGALLVALGRGNPRAALSDSETRVFFVVAEQRVSIRTIRQLQEEWPEAELVLVSLSGATPFVRKECDLQVFPLAEVVFDITTHSLVPRHTILLDHKEIPVAKEALPLLPTSDAVARFLDLRCGEVVRIDRRTRGGGLPAAIYWRRVCAP